MPEETTSTTQVLRFVFDDEHCWVDTTEVLKTVTAEQRNEAGLRETDVRPRTVIEWEAALDPIDGRTVDEEDNRDEVGDDRISPLELIAHADEHCRCGNPSYDAFASEFDRLLELLPGPIPDSWFAVYDDTDPANARVVIGRTDLEFGDLQRLLGERALTRIEADFHLEAGIAHVTVAGAGDFLARFTVEAPREPERAELALLANDAEVDRGRSVDVRDIKALTDTQVALMTACWRSNAGIADEAYGGNRRPLWAVPYPMLRGYLQTIGLWDATEARQHAVTALLAGRDGLLLTADLVVALTATELPTA